MLRLTPEQKQDLLTLLADLVAINSAVATTEQANRDRTEERMADYLTGYLQRLGMVVEWQEVFPGRPNVVAHFPDQGSGKRLVLAAHMDTVPVEGMTIPPFQAQVRDGRIYGRGSCDTKGSMAAMLTALTIAVRQDRLPADEIYFVGTMSEETGCDGATALMAGGFRADAAIVGEPTCCQVVTSHKSPLWINLQTLGRSCHASVPQQGLNAIDLMARAAAFVHGPWSEYLARQKHPLLGTSTACMTMVSGGSKINILPALCEAQIDSRLIPGRPVEAVLDDFTRMLGEYLGGGEHFRIAGHRTHPGLDCPPDAPLPRRLLNLCHQANGQKQPRGVNYFADTGPFSESGMTAVLFGPGDIVQAHTADEFIETEQLFQATEILATLLTDHVGRSIVTGD